MLIDALKARVLPVAAQPWIGLQCIDHGHEIIKPNDPFELEACTFVARPDDIGFDPADNGQADDDPVTAVEPFRIINHEAMGGNVADVQVQIAMGEVFDDHREIDRMSRRTAHISNAQVRSD